MRWLTLLLQKGRVKEFIILLIETINFVSQYLTDENFQQILGVLEQVKDIALKIGGRLFGLKEDEAVLEDIEVDISDETEVRSGIRQIDANKLNAKLEAFKNEV